MDLPWIRLDELYYTPTQVHARGELFVTMHLPNPYGPQAQNTWHTVDLSAVGVPLDAKVAFLNGILIITHGTSQETADLHITFKEHGSTGDTTKYLGQVVEAHVGGGQRSTMATWVPLKDGKFDYSYHIATQGVWPTNSAYGVNMTVQMWGR